MDFAKFFEFAGNHWELVGLFFGLLVAVIITETRRGGESISSVQLTMLINHHDALVLDVRDSKDFGNGHITGAFNIPFASIEGRVSEINKYKEKPVIIVCKMGQHSGSVGKTLKAKGFTDVKRLRGGVGTWQADGLPLIKA